MNRGDPSPAQQAFLWSLVLLVAMVVLFSFPTWFGLSGSAAQELPASAGGLSSSASVARGDTDGDTAAWPAGQAGRAVAQPCLTLAIVVYPVEPVPATWDLHYSFIVRNGCSFDCTGVVVTDTKDSRTYYRDSAPLYDDRTSENTFIWNLGNVARGQQKTVLLQLVTGPSLANLTVHNQATVDSDQTEPLTVSRDVQMGPMPVTPSPTATATATRRPDPTRTATPTQSPTPTRTATPEIVPVIELRLDPPSPSVAVGNLFDLAIRVDAGSQPVDGAEVHLDFDPAYLQVVDASGDPAGEIEDSGVLTTLIINQANNSTGQIDFAAGMLQGELPSGTFLLATVHFRALTSTAAGSTSVAFVTELPRQTNVTYSGHSVLAGVHDAAVRIGVVTATSTPTSTATRTPTPTSTVPVYHLFLPIIVR